jgi:hypothetical protein
MSSFPPQSKLQKASLEKQNFNLKLAPGAEDRQQQYLKRMKVNPKPQFPNPARWWLDLAAIEVFRLILDEFFGKI